MNPLRDALRAQSVLLYTYQPAIDELQRVLGYQQLKLDAARQTKVLAHYQASAALANLPTEFSLQHLLLPQGFPRCQDRDDQHFMALAFHAKADALVSRDKAVLALSKRAKQFGLKILDVPQLVAILG